MRAQAILALVLTLLLQTPPQTAVGTIEGTITRAGTTDMIPGVKVAVAPFSTMSVPMTSLLGNSVSDRDGRFSVNDLPPGRYTLRVQSPGFSSASNMAVVTVSAGKATVMNFPLIPDVVIRGRILDSEGKSVPNVSVDAYTIVYQSTGLPFFQSTVSKMTDDRGDYRLFGIPPGEYFVAVTPRPPTANTNPGIGTVRNVKTFYPGVINGSAATPVTLRGGEEITGINIVMQTALHVRVSGRVISAAPLATPSPANGVFAVINQTQVNSASLQLLPRDVNLPSEPGIRSSVLVLLNGSSGEFEIVNVLPGFYDLFAVVNGQTGTLIGRTPVEVIDHDVTGLTVTARPGFEVQGAIRVDGVAGADGPLRVAIQSIDSLSRAVSAYGFGLPSQTIAPSGTFSIPNVPDGKFRLSVGVPANTYVEDILQSGRSVYDSGFDVHDGTSDPLQVVVKSGAGSVEGVIRDAAAKSVSGTTVVLAPSVRLDNPMLYKSVTSDADGNFVIRGVAPGEYKLYAWPYPIGGAYYSPLVLAKSAPNGQLVTVIANSKAVVNITVRDIEP